MSALCSKDFYEEFMSAFLYQTFSSQSSCPFPKVRNMGALCLISVIMPSSRVGNMGAVCLIFENSKMLPLFVKCDYQFDTA